MPTIQIKAKGKVSVRRVKATATRTKRRVTRRKSKKRK